MVGAPIFVHLGCRVCPRRIRRMRWRGVWLRGRSLEAGHCGPGPRLPFWVRKGVGRDVGGMVVSVVVVAEEKEKGEEGGMMMGGE